MVTAILHSEYARSKSIVTNSLKTKLKEKLRPKNAFDAVMEENGGILNIKNKTCVPRSVQQVYDLNRRTTYYDEIVELLKRKRADNYGVIHLSEVPFVIIMATEWQLDLLRFMCSEQQIVGIDLTYNCTRFYVTPLTLCHPLLINSSGKMPYLMGPICISDAQNINVFKYFSAAITIKLPELRTMPLILGSDSQKTVYKGFAEFFEKVHHIFCIKHVEDNIKRKLGKAID